MNDEQTKITKGNIDQTILTRVNILCTSNPLHKKFIEEEPIIPQLAPIPKDILDRFDIIWIMNEKLDNTKIANKYMSRHRKSSEKIKQKWSNQQMREYIAYAKKLLPVITIESEKYFNTLFNKLTGDTKGHNDEVSQRLRGNILRIAYAHSKFIGIGKEDENMEIELSKESVKYAFNIMKLSFSRLGLITNDGFI